MMRTVLVVALVALPRPAVAAACEESAPLLEGEEAECDGVLVGPAKLATLLDARDELAVCRAELKASEAVSLIDRRACDQRVALVEQALARANAKLVEVDRFSWSAWLTGLGVGAAIGVIAGVVAAR
jgi:hypothetical protein